MSVKIATIDFHVTSECSQECPYCWGPQEYEHPVDTGTALRIVSKVKDVGARRIVFTGGDPLRRPDIGLLIVRAARIGLEVAVSTTGDELSAEFLSANGGHIDLISLPLDGSTEVVNSRSKEKGHFVAAMAALARLSSYPEIDVKICTPVTRHNLADVPNILKLVEAYARDTQARVFYNVFQAFPRAMFDVDWESLIVSTEDFARLRRRLGGTDDVKVNLLDYATLDRLYVMVFPDGSLVVPMGAEFRSYGRFLDVGNLDEVLQRSRFDWEKHLRHSRGWARRR
jgi:MoaA/NifB/PqqE/SkfB family radical SAM enzyme